MIIIKNDNWINIDKNDNLRDLRLKICRKDKKKIRY